MSMRKPIEDAIKAVLPAQWLAVIRAYRHRANIQRFEAEQARARRDQWRLMQRAWRHQCRQVQQQRVVSGGRVLLFPSDPRALVGSRGDDAMISAVVSAARAKRPDVVIDAFCEPGSEGIVQALGLNPIVIGQDKDFPELVASVLADGRYDAFYAIGADIIDGRFGPRIPALMVIAADLAARRGIRATILGCSFGESPDPVLRPLFGRMDRRVRLGARDPVSMQRIQSFAAVPVHLVADAAFLLSPGRIDPTVGEWLVEQREAARFVVGVNVHPMLVRDPDAVWQERMATAVAEALSRLASQTNVSWLLIPHDYRVPVGDVQVLERIAAMLRERGHVHCLLLAGHHSAADLKALVGSLHSVVTGRMHLAIASLGMGVPVLAFDYHNKFEGLLQHFRLPANLLLAPDVFEDVDTLTAAIAGFIQRQPELSQAIRSRLDAVLDLAAANFAKDVDLSGASTASRPAEIRP